MAIIMFKGEHAWLSNFWPYEGKKLIGPPCPIVWKGKEYQTREALYQASKASNAKDAEYIRTAETPGAAKYRGKEIQLRPDFNDEFAKDVMAKVVKAFFGQYPAYAQKLLDTEDHELVEGNFWGDIRWGINLKLVTPNDGEAFEDAALRLYHEGKIGTNWLGKNLSIHRAFLRFRRGFRDACERPDKESFDLW